MIVHADILVRGGFVIDPASGHSGRGDVLVRGNTFTECGPDDTVEAKQEIDAGGCLVLPGLIDYHAHLFHGGTEIGIHPDSALLPQGVTTAVDQGSAGISNCDSFFSSVVAQSRVRVFAHLHVSPTGLTTTRYPEPVDPKLFDLELSRSLLEKYAGRLLGLKIRQSRRVVGELGLKPLAATVEMADQLGCKVVVHTTDPPEGTAQLAALLRPGDVFTHMYQGSGHTILNSAKRVLPGIRQARKRGVFFDTADAGWHYAFSVIRAALADGFQPDVISTDVTMAGLWERTVFGLPLIMSKYLNLGMPIDDVVRACTATPAQLIGMSGKLGTLAPGAHADLTIFELKQEPLQFRDIFDETLDCTQLLVPRLTMLNGKIVYRSLDFLT